MDTNKLVTNHRQSNSTTIITTTISSNKHGGSKHHASSKHRTVDVKRPSSNMRQVDGYSQLYWGRGKPARDGVIPRDRLVEVEFRAGAETVFDDPRYVGQEGPTGDGSTGAS